ncbi:ethanolamine ammonia-lyase, large subunit, heavy chain [Acinetobacter proteolyticus]|jgi:ethanolamine ammonia-lyase large subunit|uniref:Ethanolamine ammonia-lyase large subunit n=1 Tax=Acinetobacter proteolyticus TaxID=1776741 RepID=A0A653K287_9GAMM|nr:ethanolamine ammonia-lyase subunit EutB [Acinetobacter proteolyticus]VXA54891.1 ethanolamine ammonia-lyase, large subunit, heavy chain [Acinetobacter proteolyticus]
MRYRQIVAQQHYQFADLKTLMAKATPLRSGDQLAGLAAQDATERVAAQITLADVPLKNFLNETLVDYETDEITRLIIDEHRADLFAPIAHFTVGDFRNWLLSEDATTEKLQQLAAGLTPEMVAAVSKIMRNQDLIYVASKCEVITQFRNTIGLKGHLSTRLQPNHPTDDVLGISASILDGLMYGNGDAVIGINPATDNLHNLSELLKLIDHVIQEYQIPTQSCVLTHISSGIQLAEKNVPIDLMFQSIAGTQKANEGFGISLQMLQEGYEATLALNRGTLGNNVMYFETGQGSALSSNAHHGVDQQTIEARAYAVARKYNPLLVNTVVGFIGPEYLYDGKQIIRAGLEDHFCGKLLGLPMGCDICYTNHADADQNDMDVLLTLFGTAGINFIMGIPGSDDVMLNYQTTSFHDALYLRQLLGLQPAPEFSSWLEQQGILKQQQQHIHWAEQMPAQFSKLLMH